MYKSLNNPVEFLNNVNLDLISSDDNSLKPYFAAIDINNVGCTRLSLYSFPIDSTITLILLLNPSFILLGNSSLVKSRSSDGFIDQTVLFLLESISKTLPLSSLLILSKLYTVGPSSVVIIK